MYCHKVGIHQPHRPHPIAIGVLPPVVRQYCRITFLKQTHHYGREKPHFQQHMDC